MKFIDATPRKTMTYDISPCGNQSVLIDNDGFTWCEIATNNRQAEAIAQALVRYYNYTKAGQDAMPETDHAY